jgi:opacity protein-like surface antigen
MRSVKFLLAAGAATLISSTAFAADMPIAPPPMYAPPAQPADFGGWYLRGDIGFSNQQFKDLRSTDAALYAPLVSFEQTSSVNTGGIFDVGVGYQFNNWFRADVIGQYRGKSNFLATDIYSFTNAGAITSGVDTYTGTKSEWLFLANGYVDLGTWWCVTPFIGAALGASRVTISNFVDTNTPTGGVNVSGPGSKWNFAWAAHAGVAYTISPSVTLELAYSYVNLGNGVTANSHNFNAPLSPYVFEVKNITSNDLKLGVRWNLDSPPVYAPPPLVTKG